MRKYFPKCERFVFLRQIINPNHQKNMRKQIKFAFFVIIIAIISTGAFANTRTSSFGTFTPSGAFSSSYVAPKYNTPSNNNTVQVGGYYNNNGTYVSSYVRTSPNNTLLDNYSTKGNYNPYTGKQGTVDPYKSYNSFGRQTTYSSGSGSLTKPMPLYPTSGSNLYKPLNQGTQSIWK